MDCSTTLTKAAATQRATLHPLVDVKQLVADVLSQFAVAKLLAAANLLAVAKPLAAANLHVAAKLHATDAAKAA